MQHRAFAHGPIGTPYISPTGHNKFLRKGNNAPKAQPNATQVILDLLYKFTNQMSTTKVKKKNTSSEKVRDLTWSYGKHL